MMPSNKFLFASFILITFVSSVLLASCPHSSDPSLTRPKREDEVSGSVDRLNNEEEELQKARLEFIKLQILQRLGMSKAPKIKRKQVDIAAYLNLFEVQQQKMGSIHSYTPSKSATATLKSSYETDKVFVSPVFSTPLSSTFNLTLNPHSSQTSSVHRIVLYLKQQISQEDLDREITIFTRKDSEEMFMRKLGKAEPQPLPSLPEYENDIKELSAPWFEYDVTDILYDEVTTRRGNYIVVNPKSKKLKIFSALITIEFDDERLRRRKRSVDCSVSNSSSCCRESFYVNFTHIGWDNWILQPPGYSANYCKGQCDVSHARYHHTTVVQKYPSTISLCCSPREMSHISLIYVDEDGFVYQKILQNMTVESCDCA